MARNTLSLEAGVTLVELMVTLAVLAILLAVAVPSFATLIASSRLTASTNELLSAMAQSRSEALRRGQRVVLCIQDPGNPGQCTNAGDWEQGWLAFVDLDRDNVLDPPLAAPAPSEEVVLATPNQAADLLIPANITTRRVVYLPSGRVLSGGSIRVCSTSTALSDNIRARQIDVNAAGQTILTQPVVTSACPAP